MNVAVIGGGYAGMAAAVTLTEQGVPVTVFESGRTLGGRARRVEHAPAVLDNGLHILLGAYDETLRLMQRVGADANHLLLRLPFAWHIRGHLAITAAPLPGPFHMAAGLMTARGLTLGDRVDAARLLIAMRRAAFRLPQDMSVASLLQSQRQGPALRRLLWHPLCIAALNTLPEQASAQVFLNVLRDSLAGGRHASDLLLPRTDLSALFPDPAADWVAAHGGKLAKGQRVLSIGRVGAGFAVCTARGTGLFTHVICAVGPHQLGHAVRSMPGLESVCRLVERLAYQPIYSVYLQYPEPVRLEHPMTGFDGGLLHWIFDREALAGQRGLLGAVISAGGGHETLAHDVLGRLAHEEVIRHFPLPAPTWVRVIAEKRATFACLPGMVRPDNRTPVDGFVLAGDYTAADYPATLESAVRSGIAAARLALAEH